MASSNQNRTPLNQLLNENFNLLVFVVVLVFFVLAYLLFLGGQFRATTAAIKDNVESQKRLYAEQKKKLSDLERAQALYSKIKPSDLAKFNNVLPGEYIKEQLFGELEEIIVKNGFLINSVSLKSDQQAATAGNGMPEMVAAAAEDKYLGKIEIDVSVGGVDYNGLKSLLKIIESNSRLLDVKSVAMGENSAQLTMTTYYYRTQK